MNPVLEQMRSYTGREFSDTPSPFMRWLAPTLVSAEEGTLIFSYTVRKEMLNPAGTLHGGVTAGIIDDSIGATVISLDLPDVYTTINNAIDYFAPAFENDVIEARTSVVKQGRQIINLACEVWMPAKNRLVAKGASNMMRIAAQNR
ncbi:MAG: PaaI family thioesterase [Mucilaginibacter polytrichastri]|nr:PaaI family thioesterase [Mucilaginibacter polytrichastri]